MAEDKFNESFGFWNRIWSTLQHVFSMKAERRVFLKEQPVPSSIVEDCRIMLDDATYQQLCMQEFDLNFDRFGQQMLETRDGTSQLLYNSSTFTPADHETAFVSSSNKKDELVRGIERTIRDVSHLFNHPETNQLDQLRVENERKSEHDKPPARSDSGLGISVATPVAEEAFWDNNPVCSKRDNDAEWVMVEK